MDDRIGKQGEGGYRPEKTIIGRTLRKRGKGRDAEQIFITRGLGNGYYCVVDPGIIPDLEELIDELKGKVKNEPKRKKHVIAPLGETDNTV
ncbi:hypothetical protein LCGC14_1308250 [marine sediment metagenome]|uniref:Uncharacterized protein n=1 Tax=marine sediment metagenome TaxID=412755 RepID=A0A0F9KN49_9ZZZZ